MDNNGVDDEMKKRIKIVGISLITILFVIGMYGAIKMCF